MKNEKKAAAKEQDQMAAPIEFALAKENYVLMAIGFGIIILGFILMIGGATPDPNQFYPNGDPSQTPEMFSFRRITLAPVLVLAGFVFEVFAIMKKPKELAE